MSRWLASLFVVFAAAASISFTAAFGQQPSASAPIAPLLPPPPMPFVPPVPTSTVQILRAEPGQLPPGATVLIDDGTCPTGQLKQVIAGTAAGQPRLRSCVPRP